MFFSNEFSPTLKQKDMTIDFKITTWERVHIPEHIENKVMNKLRKGLIQNSNDLYRFFEDEGLSINIVENVDSPVEVEENGGYPTIEVRKRKETLWTNTPKN
jgi:hypothetical protein